jgi:hypothetical protein
LKALKAGAVRIDLEGNSVGTVTAADEADAERKKVTIAGDAQAGRDRCREYLACVLGGRRERLGYSRADIAQIDYGKAGAARGRLCAMRSSAQKVARISST